MLSGASSSNGAPQSLEQLLERQWEQGSQFLMEQAQHFDSKIDFFEKIIRFVNKISILVASLLSCLHQLKIENSRLEDHINSLVSRRDHLLAVNARLAIPLGQQSATTQGKFFYFLAYHGCRDKMSTPKMSKNNSKVAKWSSIGKI